MNTHKRHDFVHFPDACVEYLRAFGNEFPLFSKTIKPNDWRLAESLVQCTGESSCLRASFAFVLASTFVVAFVKCR